MSDEEDVARRLWFAVVLLGGGVLGRRVLLFPIGQ